MTHVLRGAVLLACGVAAVGGCELVSGLSDLEFDGLGGQSPGGGGGGDGATSSGTSVASATATGTSGGGGDGGAGGGGPVLVDRLFNARERRTCARRGADFFCWGQKYQANLLQPQLVTFPDDTAHVAALFYNECVVDTAGALRCWGADNDLGELGLGDTGNYPTPGPTVSLPAAVLELSAGDSSCALVATQPQSAYCWGDNSYAVVEFPEDALPHPTPGLLVLPAPTSSVDQVHVGRSSACARRGTEVLCWGHNQDGRLGLGFSDNVIHPPTAIATSEPVKELLVMGSAGCILNTFDEAFCWGSPWDFDGVVVAVPFLDGATGLSAGGDHVCGIRGGEVVCAGHNHRRQLGSPDVFTYEATPDVPGTPTQVVAGYDQTCALNDLGEIYCWGSNFGGALGIGSPDEGDFAVPQLVTLPPP